MGVGSGETQSTVNTRKLPEPISASWILTECSLLFPHPSRELVRLLHQGGGAWLACKIKHCHLARDNKLELSLAENSQVYSLVQRLENYVFVFFRDQVSCSSGWHPPPNVAKDDSI